MMNHRSNVRFFAPQRNLFVVSRKMNRNDRIERMKKRLENRGRMGDVSSGGVKKAEPHVCEGLNSACGTRSGPQWQNRRSHCGPGARGGAPPLSTSAAGAAQDWAPGSAARDRGPGREGPDRVPAASAPDRARARESDRAPATGTGRAPAPDPDGRAAGERGTGRVRSWSSVLPMVGAGACCAVPATGVDTYPVPARPCRTPPRALPWE
jgi:hypothetical protein